MVKIRTTVYIDDTISLMAKAQGINVSAFCNEALMLAVGIDTRSDKELIRKQREQAMETIRDRVLEERRVLIAEQENKRLEEEKRCIEIESRQKKLLDTLDEYDANALRYIARIIERSKTNPDDVSEADRCLRDIEGRCGLELTGDEVVHAIRKIQE